jgi:type II secretory pathway pseudopilin PulG
MVLKILNKKASFYSQRGITFIDVITTVAIITVLFLAIALILNPVEMQERGRDEKRMSDLNHLDRAISEYLLDADSFPDTIDTTRYSNVLPAGNSGPFEDSTDGWIDQNMVQYLVRFPTDPLNDTTYRYSYRHSVATYELNAVLEYYVEEMQNDGGNNSAIYELGNDLTIL